MSAEMSIFKDQLISAHQEQQGHFHKMFQFGGAMMEAMGLTPDDLLVANGMRWDIPGFQLSVRSFPQNNWAYTIVVSPTGVDTSKIGYSNTAEEPPKGWYYNGQGTATVFYPPEMIQKIILGRIKGTN